MDKRFHPPRYWVRDYFYMPEWNVIHVSKMAPGPVFVIHNYDVEKKHEHKTVFNVFGCVGVW